MADSTRDLAIYCKEGVVRGHHVFKRIWTPVFGKVLTVAIEAGNTEDRFAVAVTKDDMVVGHVPREFSKLCRHFLRHGGTIAFEVTGRRKRSCTCSSCRIRIADRRHFHTRTILESQAVRCYRKCVYALNKLQLRTRTSRALIKKYALISEF